MLDSAAWRPQRSLMLGTIALAVLLALLARMQYRWLGQIGEADAERMRAGARTRAAQLARDFDREITLAFLWLQVDAATLESGDARAYAARWTRWSRLAVHPGIVEAVYVVEHERLSRYVPGAEAFRAAAWPAALESVRERLRDAGRPPQAGVRGGRGFFDPVDPELSTILTPVPDFRPPAASGGARRLGPRLLGFTLIQLDESQLRELLASLAKRHFATGGESDYAIRVDRRGRPAALVFASDSGVGADAPADATVGLFGIRFAGLTDSDLAGLPWPTPDGVSRREARPAASGRRPPPFGDNPDFGHWRLLARHRAGSVDAVVASVRKRNLAVSAGVLAMLLASAGLIVVSAQRARRLADRQVEFVAGVSHELRTPLSTICAAGDNLAAGVVTDPAAAREYGRVVRDEGRRLSEMVERVLDLAGTYSGHRRWRFEIIEVEPVLAECLEALAPLARERGLGLESRVEGPLPRVRAERSAVRRAVGNLLQNAILHGGDGGWVALGSQAAGPEGEQRVRITVADRGPGIPASELPHLFEPFYRGAGAVSSQTRGSGLGLSLVKRIVDAHGGVVEVKTSPGRGSAFTIVLPAATGSLDEPPHPAG